MKVYVGVEAQLHAFLIWELFVYQLETVALCCNIIFPLVVQLPSGRIRK
jgi:hypothetical protein